MISLLFALAIASAPAVAPIAVAPLADTPLADTPGAAAPAAAAPIHAAPMTGAPITGAPIALEDRVANAGAAFLGATAGGLVASSAALMASSALGFSNDARALAVVLAVPPLVEGASAFAATSMAGAEPAWLVGVAALVGSGIAAGGVGALAAFVPGVLSDDFAATLLILVGAPTLGGALAAAAVAPFLSTEPE